MSELEKFKSYNLFDNLNNLATSKNFRKDYLLKKKPRTATNISPSNGQSVKNNSNLKPAIAYIFNQEGFGGFASSRHGSTKDVEALQKTFEKFEVDVTVEKDGTLDHIKSVMAKLKEEDFESVSAVIIVVLSNGDFSDYYTLHPTIVSPLIQNLTLQNKPKIFIVSAFNHNKDIKSLEKDATPSGGLGGVLILHNTFEAPVSDEDKAKGTIFIQKLCELIDSHAKTETIEKIFELVQQNLRENTYQVPRLTTTFTPLYVLGKNSST